MVALDEKTPVDGTTFKTFDESGNDFVQFAESRGFPPVVLNAGRVDWRLRSFLPASK
jgi:hypothetical protein